MPSASTTPFFVPRLTRYLPAVLLATFVVAVCPLLIAWALEAAGVIQSEVLSVLLGIALSLGASWAGGAVWRSRPGSGDLLFGDLMLWGWLRRLWVERELASTLHLLEGLGASDDLSVERRSQLLTKLAASLEARDPYTHGHSRRVARHSAMIAKRMGLPQAQVAKIRTAAALHDVGKINTPPSCFTSPASSLMPSSTSSSGTR